MRMVDCPDGEQAFQQPFESQRAGEPTAGPRLLSVVL